MRFLHSALPGALVLAIRLGASPEPPQMAVVERLPAVPDGWSFRGGAGEDERMLLAIALRQPDIPRLKERLALAPSQHLTGAQLERFRRPTSTSVDAVIAWLHSHGIFSAVQDGAWVRLNASARAVHDLFSADLAYYAWGDAEPVLRSEGYSVPVALRRHIEFVYPLTHFMPPRSASRSLKIHASGRGGEKQHPEAEKRQIWSFPCYNGVTPDCLKEWYQISYLPTTMATRSDDNCGGVGENNSSSPATSNTARSPVRFGVAGFLEQYIAPDDVSSFLSQHAPSIATLNPPYNFTISLINNGTNPTSPSTAGMEASLDVEYAMGLAYPANVVYYSTAGRSTKLNINGEPVQSSDNEPYLEFLEHLVSLPDDEVPHVLSISYTDDEQSVPRAYATRVCDLFAQLAARGASVLVASGDGGAAGTGGTQCYLNNDDGGGGGSGGGRTKAFLPTFPASCPYVTAVGATMHTGPPVGAAVFSSGGYSRYFDAPAWQANATAAYAAALPGTAAGARIVDNAMFSASGRGIPDLSAVGSMFRVRWGGSEYDVAGTSASTPVVAALVALVDDARMRAGKPPLGWLNPRLYGAVSDKAGALEDVTAGSSRGCYFMPGDGGTIDGWPALKGWDAVTGLGSIADFGAFLEALS